MRNSISALLIASVLGVSGVASAATTSTSFSVTATVLKTCSATSANLAFGSYTPGAGALTGSTAVNVKCTNGTTFTVALNAGTTTGGTIAQRLMANGSNTLQYNLYTTSSYTTIFGDGTGGSSPQNGTGTGLGSAVAVNVYGQLPDNATNQNAVPGIYSDTITATVTY
ncbi:MAG TPA: spore coat protein U domain-containing protein [Steroidobacteraceae bacterium]|nr:spore coat protein U domain-containing protein [Steroidobacteraceae bacterium]